MPLIRGQKLPIFSGSGLSHNKLAVQIVKQAKIADSEGKDFAVVFAAMGVQNDVAEYFRRSFEETGVIQRVCMFLNLSNDPKRLYKEVWIGLGGVQSAVYATETSVEEYLTYTTEESEKMQVMELAEKLGGDIEAAIQQLACKRETKTES